jgi:hypothetical protein
MRYRGKRDAPHTSLALTTLSNGVESSNIEFITEISSAMFF